MKVKDLIAKLQKCDQEMHIVLEHHIDCQDDEIGCYLPWDIINEKYPELGLRYDTVNTWKEKDPCSPSGEEHEVAYFEDMDDPIQSRMVIVLSSTQFKYGSGKDKIGDN